MLEVKKEDYYRGLVTRVNGWIKSGLPVATACKKCGISKPTFYHWKRAFPPVDLATTNSELGTMTLTFKSKLTDMPKLIEKLQSAGLGSHLCTLLFEEKGKT
jgi:ACT domain-containing protein